jgi:hypothetical protein
MRNGGVVATLSIVGAASAIRLRSRCGPTGSCFLCHTVSVTKTLNKRAHVVLPIEVVVSIDKLVGKRGRSAFLTELAQREIKLRLQRQALRESAGAWKSEDHPELANGSAAWVQQIRSLDSRRFEELEKRRSAK